MTAVQRLIEETDDGGLKAQHAVAELAAIGLPVVADVAEAIRSERGNPMVLREVLLQIRDPEIVTILRDVVQDENATLSQIAIEALGQSRDARALKPLLRLLPTWRKNMAVDALGELGNSEAIPYLLHIVHELSNDSVVLQAIEGKLDEAGSEEFDRDCLRVLIHTIIALAKLGNCEYASVMFSLAHYHCDCDSNAFFIRKEAVRALQYVAVPGMLPVLRLALHDEDAEVRSSAVDALFYLGLKESLDLIVTCGHDTSDNVLNTAMIRLHDLTGQFIEDQEPHDVETWWQAHQQEYNAGVCYRLGKPLYVPDVIELLADPNRGNAIAKELNIITGHDFGCRTSIPVCTPTEVVEHARQWWRVEGGHFEPGALYKYGRKQEITNLTDIPKDER